MGLSIFNNSLSEKLEINKSKKNVQNKNHQSVDQWWSMYGSGEAETSWDVWLKFQKMSGSKSVRADLNSVSLSLSLNFRLFSDWDTTNVQSLSDYRKNQRIGARVTPPLLARLHRVELLRTQSATEAPVTSGHLEFSNGVVLRYLVR